MNNQAQRMKVISFTKTKNLLEHKHTEHNKTNNQPCNQAHLTIPRFLQHCVELNEYHLNFHSIFQIRNAMIQLDITTSFRHRNWHVH